MRLLSVLSAIIAFTCASTFAAVIDPTLLANDKEAFTRFYSSKDLAQAKVRLSGQAQPRAALAAAWHSSLEKLAAPACEIRLEHSLREELRVRGFATEFGDRLAWLILLRDANEIDDLTLDLLLKSTRLLGASDLQSLGQVAPGFPRYATGLNRRFRKASTEVTTLVSQIYRETLNKPSARTECLSDLWQALQTRLRIQLGKLMPLNPSQFNRLALSLGAIDERVFYQLEALNGAGVQFWPLTLKPYLAKLSVAKNQHKPGSTPNAFSSGWINSRAKISRRSFLYSRYNGPQIVILSDALLTLSKRISAPQAKVVIEYDEDPAHSETYTLSPMEQYRMAQRMLRKDLVALQNSPIFAGIQIDFVDLITAALETGVIGQEQVNSMLTMDDLWNPYVPAWKKWSALGFRTAGIATGFIPAPFNLLGAVGLVLIEANLPKDVVTDNPNSIF